MPDDYPLPGDESPAGRVLRDAAAATTAELWAVVLGGPQAAARADAIVAHFGDDLRCLYHAPCAELTALRGVGTQGAARIKAVLELARRLHAPPQAPSLNTPEAAAAVVQDMALLEQEHLRVLLLDRRNRVITIREVYQGSLNTATLRVGELFREAIRHNCAAIVVAHNHPSGDPTPSPEDIAATQRMVEAGKLLGIEVLDHLVIGRGAWVSLRRGGLGFQE